MKNLTFTFYLLLTVYSSGQITYVDNFDAVYPYVSSGTMMYNFDIDSDGNNDVMLRMKLTLNLSSVCNIPGYGNQSCSNSVAATFEGLSNSFGSNKINSASVVNNTPTLDCTGDTLNILDSWNSTGWIYRGCTPPFCITIGEGNHKQGFQLISLNPATGVNGYKYGYIDYTLTNTGDIVIHGWYYENTFNVPIAANSLLDYPYDGNCIVYDTVTVYDTVAVYDTIYVSVTDTLFIETTLSTNPITQNTLTVFPNPSNDHITINTGNYALMPNYTVRIENSAGQTVFTNLVNQPLFYIDITGWTGTGLYYLYLIDPQNNTVTVRKIVLQ
jgi:hypothetical protein